MVAKKNSCERIITAAEDLLIEEGYLKFTLERVALQAGVSKGGLLYHFPTKESLLQAVIKRLIDNIKIAIDSEEEKMPASCGRRLKAYIKAWLTRNSRLRKIAGALIPLVLYSPKLVKPIREVFRETFDRFQKSGVPRDVVSIVFFSLEGFWIMELLGVVSEKNMDKTAMTEKLMELVEETE